jgi:hypothetical protein
MRWEGETPMREEVRLPVVFDGGEHNDRLVQGVILKCVDGHWKAQDDTPLNEGMTFFVFGVTTGLQHWQDGALVKEIKKRPGEELPDVDELNAAIPQDQWDDGIDGNPRPPWQLNDVVYLLGVQSAMKFTFINSTIGARIAAARLLDRIESMQIMRGPGVIPIVKLESRPMKTKFGEKQRPHFEPVDWRDLGPATPAVSSPQSSPLIGTSVDPAQVGKPVTEPTLSEELNDSIPL